MTGRSPTGHFRILRILSLAPVALLSACGSDFLWVETINPPSTTTTSTSTTTTTTRPRPTTTTRPATTSTTTAGARHQAEAAPPVTRPSVPRAGQARQAGQVGQPDQAGHTGQATAPPTTPSTPPAPQAPPRLTAPLTGLPMEAGAASGRPVLVVKIDNAPLARPQIGLNQADVVFEEGVEGGITRFAALFHSKPSDPVGPVRSARSTDINIVSPLRRPLFAYSGANDVFKEYISRAPLVDVGVDAYPDRYHRDNGRSSPHNLFSTTPRLHELAPDGSRPPPALFPFRNAGEAASGAGARPVTRATAFWRGPSKETVAVWDWNDTAQGWRRTQNGEDHVDGAGRQVIPANVVVQFVNYRDTGLVDSSGTSVPEAEVLGEGDAWILTGGKLVPARWSKPSAEEITRYVDYAGAEVRLAPGRTWVELVPPGQCTAL